MTYVSNSAGHSQWALQSGVEGGSRWGLKGSEDLGGGTNAIFQLEVWFATHRDVAEWALEHAQQT